LKIARLPSFAQAGGASFFMLSPGCGVARPLRNFPPSAFLLNLPERAATRPRGKQDLRPEAGGQIAEKPGKLVVYMHLMAAAGTSDELK